MKHYFVYIRDIQIYKFMVDAENEEEAKELAVELFETEGYLSKAWHSDTEDYQVVNVEECVDIEYSAGEDFIKIRVPSQIKKEFKIFCAEKNKSMQDILNATIKNFIKRP
jgi:phosphosulfolactate phosphohydrolase-like enzyme